MNNDFCPDCGHLMSRRVTQCAFCGWSDRVDYLVYRGYDREQETDLIFTYADEVCAELGLSA